MSNQLPRELIAVFEKDETASSIFQALSPSHQREYIAWISDAKKEETRQKRAEKTATMLKEKRGGRASA